MEQKKLIALIKSGDQQAAHHLYKTYAQYLYNTVNRMTGDDALTKDILQEAFVKIFNKISSFRGDANLKYWMRSIAVNLTLSHFRKRSLYFEEIESSQIPDDPEPELNAYQEEMVYHIHHEIKKLPEGGRIIFSLFAIEGYSHQEIAEHLNISISTSKTQYKRAKDQIRERLQSKLNVYG